MPAIAESKRWRNDSEKTKKMKMKKSQKTTRHKKEYYQAQTNDRKICDAVGCDREGLYKAPKSPDTVGQDYYFFCLQHVQEYNKAWNFFASYSDEDMEKAYADLALGDRKTKPLFNQYQRATKLMFEQLKSILGDDFDRLNIGKNDPTQDQPFQQNIFKNQSMWNEKQKQALRILLLDVNASEADIRQQYKNLVKKYHPDGHKNDKEFFENKLKKINHAYGVLLPKK
jgi:hypothetical protein